jgi:Fe-S oxidoreductase/nitrate reductase gamma subunit
MNAAATREIYWNITHVWVMYGLLVPAMGIAAYGLWRHVARWRRGTPLGRFDRPAERWRLVLAHAVAQRRTARERYTGLFHRFITYGFVILTIATIVVGLDADFGTSIMRGRFYLYFQSFAVDVFGALVVIGIAMAALRRFVGRPAKLVYSPEAALILAAIFTIAVTGFLLEGWRIAGTNDPWGPWSPFGNLIARASSAVMSAGALRAAHRATWWLHLAVSFAFFSWLPWTKLVHIVTAPLNIYTANLAPIGASLKSVDFEAGTTLGVSTLGEMTWKDLLDLDACTECGRCTDVCPAHTVGKALSPRDIILQLRDLSRGHLFAPDKSVAARSIIGTVPATAPEALWECTTCAACVEACPVYIEQMPKIVDMRRHLVMEQAEFPDTVQEAIQSLEKRGHPFSGTQATRLDWAEGLDVPHVSEANDAEVLFWVGCGGALVERNQKVIRATAQLLRKAGVSFAILGRDEKCSGDPARRIGNEFLFEKLARENVATLNKHRVRKVITPCPHCFNTFRNEYPRYGGAFEVYHHSEYLARLVAEGRIVPASAPAKKVAFHDPCYLGRQNGVYDAPRDVLQATAATVEMPRSRANSFCCGGGGGMSFVDEPAGRRVNEERAAEALATGADVLAVSCPFCMTMMQDGINARKGVREMAVMDISEVLWEATQASSALRVDQDASP